MNDYLVTFKHLHSDMIKSFIVEATHSQFAKLFAERFLRKHHLISTYRVSSVRPVENIATIHPSIRRLDRAK